MASTSHASRTVRTLLVVVALALVAAGCSDDGSDGADAPSGATTTSTTSPDGATTEPDGGGSGGGGGGGTTGVTDGIRIEVLSSQPDRVSGPEARVRVTPEAGGDPEDLAVRRGDDDVTGQLEVVDGALEGVVTGFVEGNNTLTVEGGGATATQRIRAWPITGPVLSGPHLPLLACATEANGLGAPTDDDCSAETTVSWSYVTTADALAPLPDRRTTPDDLATATIDGREVPLYVRVEKGVINRSVYEIASVDPTPGDDDPTGGGWNQRLLYRFGGLCGATFGQGSPATAAAAPTYLAQGYAVATASFNNFSVQCNDVLSAETTMMVKERFIEEFGTPELTIGEGAGGGAMQLHLLIQNYPGLVDGAAATSPFPDVFSVLSGVSDCGLLQRYYASAAGFGLSPAQRAAVNGHATAATCATWDLLAGSLLDPTKGCDPAIPPEAVYDAETNPGGVRCTVFDANLNQLGVDPATGHAVQPLDNVGVQYGLAAFNAGTITAEQFLDLNATIGGYDADGVPVPERKAADPEVVLNTYSSGRIANGGGDLLDAPILDVDVYTDPSGDVHDAFRGPSLRARLAPESSPEEAPGLRLWARDPGDLDLQTALDRTGRGSTGPEAVAAVDDWLTALRADTEGGARSAALQRTRPAEADDNCQADGAAAPITGTDVFAEDGACTEAFPRSGDPRTAAGAPLADDILKCQLKAPDPSDYEQELTSEQYDRLFQVFPEGVCDWTGSGVGETLPADPDRDYGDVETPATRV